MASLAVDFHLCMNWNNCALIFESNSRAQIQILPFLSLFVLILALLSCSRPLHSSSIFLEVKFLFFSFFFLWEETATEELNG